MATPRDAVLAACLAVLAAAASATQFRVGGQKGWSVPAAGDEPFNAWASRMRFQIGDQLLFVYPNGSDSVLLVEPAAYNACNTSAYDKKFADGATVFTLDRSGPFFFISGNDASCRANEKLIVVVLADRSGARTPPAPTPSTAPPPAPTPSSSPPTAAAPAPAPTATPTSSPPASAPVSPPSTTPGSPPSPAAPAPATSPATPGGVPQPPSASANAPGAEGGGSTTPPAPSGAAPAVAGVVGSLGAYLAYAMLAI
ncbi:hypothetical protein ACP4OV_013831 [Aristida adscensionis]